MTVFNIESSRRTGDFIVNINLQIRYGHCLFSSSIVYTSCMLISVFHLEQFKFELKKAIWEFSKCHKIINWYYENSSRHIWLASCLHRNFTAAFLHIRFEEVELQRELAVIKALVYCKGWTNHSAAFLWSFSLNLLKTCILIKKFWWEKWFLVFSKPSLKVGFALQFSNWEEFN